MTLSFLSFGQKPPKSQGFAYDKEASRQDMLKICILLLILGLGPAESRRERGSAKIETGHYHNQERKGKLFSLFSIVNFRNTGCQSSEDLPRGQSEFRNGTCYTSTECEDKGGSAEGGCAAGFGVCCIFVINSATSVTENCTYLQNPSFPTADTASDAGLSYTIQRCNNDVCMLRLDFETFTLQGPISDDAVTEGACPDIFVVSVPGTNQIIPTLCGENSGYHIYVDIGADNGNTASIDITLDDATFGRSWDIKVTQLECGNPTRPANTCLQYLTGLTGRIETFNYKGNENNQHLENQNYAVCIRAEPGMCCIQYRVCPDQVNTNPNELQPGFSLDPVISNMAMQDDACAMTDYVGIDQSADSCQSGTSTMPGTVANRYCGLYLNFIDLSMNNQICDCTPPFTVNIFTNADPDQAGGNSIQSRGLCLEYTQVACS